ncbi:MAG: hypothetical protein ABWY95_01610 [Thermoleophilaceae bacterium]
MRREKRREEQFDQELRYLLDEAEERPGAAPIVEHERDAEPADPDKPRVETAASL